MTGIAKVSVRELDRMLETAVGRLRKACAVDLAFAGPLNLGERDSITIRHLAGNLGHSLRHLRVSAGAGLGGKALALGRPIVVQDYFNAPQIVHAYDRAVAPEHVHTALAVPVRMHGSPVGLLYVAQRENVAFGDRTVSRAMAVARHLEHDLTIDQEVRRRVAAYSAHTIRDTHALDELHRELEATTALIDDPATRQRLDHVSKRLARIISGSGSITPKAVTPTGGLSVREIDVLGLVATGASNNDIATELGLMPNTVKAYLRSIARKLGASNRTHAVRLAREARLID